MHYIRGSSKASEQTACRPGLLSSTIVRREWWWLVRSLKSDVAKIARKPRQQVSLRYFFSRIAPLCIDEMEDVSVNRRPSHSWFLSHIIGPASITPGVLVAWQFRVSTRSKSWRFIWVYLSERIRSLFIFSSRVFPRRHAHSIVPRRDRGAQGTFTEARCAGVCVPGKILGNLFMSSVTIL